AGYPEIYMFFNKLETLGGYGTNICTLAPHGLIRQVLFGDDQPKEGLSPQQFQDMEKRFRCQMEQGTIGFSTGLEYDPGSYSDTTELIELAKVVRKYDGLYATHTRDQTGTGVPPTDWGVLRSIDEAIKIGIEADIPVHVSHLQVTTPWNDVTAFQILEKIENARQGPHAIDITGCIHTYNIGWGPLNYRLPREYKKVNGIKDIYKSGEKRLEVQAAIQKVFDEYLPAEKIQICSWEDERYNMQYISDLVKQPEFPENKGKTPAECFVDIVAKDPDVPAPYAYSDEINGDIKDGIIPGDHIFMSSDGLASSEDPKRDTPIVHPRTFNNATRVLTKFVKPADGAVMDLSTAIKKMTSLPAEKFKLRERGRIEEGYFADIVVINRGKLKSNATFEIENRYSEGVEYSLVNGVLAIDNGKATDQRPGKILRRV
ncbi:MAG: amidohydrolase family protein, partial [Proteobacteria bacterium]|nr:amidohydrolase family protein [Pseudomonadota bacterium]